MENLIAASVFIVFAMKLILAIVALYLGYRIFADPTIVGWFFGEIARGFQEAFP